MLILFGVGCKPDLYGMKYFVIPCLKYEKIIEGVHYAQREDEKHARLIRRFTYLHQTRVYISVSTSSLWIPIIVVCSCKNAFLFKCMSSQQKDLVYALGQDVPKLVYAFWICKPVGQCSVDVVCFHFLKAVCLITSKWTVCFNDGEQ